MEAGGLHERGTDVGLFCIVEADKSEVSIFWGRACLWSLLKGRVGPKRLGLIKLHDRGATCCTVITECFVGVQ
jgi:hypothetical protein